MRIDAIGNDGNKDSYFGVMEEIWELEYGPLMIPLFRCQWVNRAGGGITIDRYGMTIVDFKKIGYKDEPFVLAKDVNHVFFVPDKSTKPKKGKNDKDQINVQPKRHIVLLGKRNIVGIEDISDMSHDYEKEDRIVPFIVNKDPSVLLNAEETPWKRKRP